MRLYLTATTNIPDVYIDFIEVKLKSGEEVSLNWDESDISRSDSGFNARYKGVYFGDDYANGRITDLEGMKITDIGLYYEAAGTFDFQIKEMEFEDGDKTLTITDPVIPLGCSGLEGLKPTSLGQDKDESIPIILTKQEIEKIQEALDVMGDRVADREGYSSGEAYWDLKEKLEACKAPAETQQQKVPKVSLADQIKSAASRISDAQSSGRAVAKEPEAEI